MSESGKAFRIGVLAMLLMGIVTDVCVDFFWSTPREQREWERNAVACQFAGYDTAVVDAGGALFCTKEEGLVLYEVEER